MFTRSAQCVHSTEACCWGVIPGAVPKCGFRASGESPRQPLMHSVDPGVGMYGMRIANGFGTTAELFSPSSSDRFAQLRHIESGLAMTLRSIQRSSSSQSPTWIVCVTMSGYEYCGIPASMQARVVLPVDVLLDRAAGASDADRVHGLRELGDEAVLDHDRRLAAQLEVVVRGRPVRGRVRDRVALREARLPEHLAP